MALFVGLVGVIAYFVVRLLSLPVSTLMVVMVMSLVYVGIQYFFADKLALMSTGAKAVDSISHPRLWTIVKRLADKQSLPMPALYIIDDAAPNAFATGRNPQKAVVAATTGILDIMDDRELSAVLAHELSHVKNYDIRVSMIAFGLVSVVGAFTNFLSWGFMFGGSDEDDQHPAQLIVSIALVFLAPLAALMIQMAVSRQREYLADASGAGMTDDAEGLARALEKLRDNAKPLLRQDTTTAHLFIANPLRAGAIDSLFSTHPPLDERIKRLRGQR
jgi:heat shock protein HtpX